MVRLKELPNRQTIDGFKGVIDFYLWKGIPCARKWPTHKPRAPYPLEHRNQQAFAYINRLWASLSPALKEAYNQMASGTPYTGKDLSVIAFMSGIDYAEE